MTRHLDLKEICSHCQKNVRIGLPHFECSSCAKIFHAKCFKPSHSETTNNKFYCKNCIPSIIKKYNPFKVMLDDNERNGTDPYLQKMSSILENCKQYTIRDFNSVIEPYQKDGGGMIFQNIDGNRTNFDTFSVELERLSFKFQVIGLAETNVEQADSQIYQLDGYKHFYQDKHVNKAKGTGVALYVKESLNAVVEEELSWVSKNLETLFITIQHDEPVHVGVVYRVSSP